MGTHDQRGLCGADLLQVVIWLTPAGTVDEGGLTQPAYLNFDTALLGPPTGHEMQAKPQSSCSRWVLLPDFAQVCCAAASEHPQEQGLRLEVVMSGSTALNPLLAPRRSVQAQIC